MIFTVDYHVHPNLPKNKSKALVKCRNWWKALENAGVNTVIVTEHCYKDPQRAFELMEQTKPKGFFMFPGIELLTKEGIDLIIFSQTKRLYEYEELKPFKLTFDEAINFILNNNLAGFITHPHTKSSISIISALGKGKYRHYTEKMGSVEITNAVFNNMYLLLKKPILKKIFFKEIKRMERIKNLPKEDYPRRIRFLAAGSDAHHFEELGTFVTINASPSNLFKKITTSKNPKVTIKNYSRVNYSLLIKTIVNVIIEIFTKETLKFKDK